MPDEILSILPSKTCKKCQLEIIGKVCIPCRRAKAKAWKIANNEKVVAGRVAYYARKKEQIQAKTAEWRLKNPERVKAVTAAYRENNPEKVLSIYREYNKLNVEKRRLSNAAWYKANHKEIRAAYKLWRQTNPDAARLYYSNRRGKVAKAGGVLSKGLAAKLFSLQGGKCPCCAKPLGEDYHLDHKVPIFLGGSNTDDNMQLLRKTCNLQKGTKHPVDFMQQRGFLL